MSRASSDVRHCLKRHGDMSDDEARLLRKDVLHSDYHRWDACDMDVHQHPGSLQQSIKTHDDPDSLRVLTPVELEQFLETTQPAGRNEIWHVVATNTYGGTDLMSSSSDEDPWTLI